MPRSLNLRTRSNGLTPTCSDSHPEILVICLHRLCIFPRRKHNHNTSAYKIRTRKQSLSPPHSSVLSISLNGTLSGRSAAHRTHLFRHCFAILSKAAGTKTLWGRNPSGSKDYTVACLEWDERPRLRSHPHGWLPSLDNKNLPGIHAWRQLHDKPVVHCSRFCISPSRFLCRVYLHGRRGCLAFYMGLGQMVGLFAYSG